MAIEKEVLMADAEQACKSFQSKHPNSQFKFDWVTKSSIFMKQGPYKLKFYLQIKNNAIFATVYWEDMYVKKVQIRTNKLGKHFIYRSDIEHLCFNVVKPFYDNIDKEDETEETTKIEEPITVEPKNVFHKEWKNAVEKINNYLTEAGYTIPTQMVSIQQQFSIGEYNFKYRISPAAFTESGFTLKVFYQNDLLIKSYGVFCLDFDYANVFHTCLIEAIKRGVKSE